MRHGRAKSARRTLKFYALNGGKGNGSRGDARFNPPYAVLCDGNFLVAAIRQKIPLRERLSKLLQGAKFELHVCRSALDELRDLAEAHEKGNLGDVFHEARQFGLDECEIVEDGDIVPASADGVGEGGLGKPGEDILRLVSSYSDEEGDEKKAGSVGAMPIPNPRCYLVGTQDESLSDAIRSLPLVPQMRLHRSVLLLESPSAASRRYAAGSERRKELSGGAGLASSAVAKEREVVDAVRDQERTKRAEEHRREVAEELRKAGMDRRKKKAKGPNPLSCKKKHKADGE
eukprot:CAMPEP_0183308152 /NCGR_PEP_ID=MMETSP0160_2-20130417/20101_1 /TAXON_ID=2839 ORGANISM="Odontella Sinensis, Strain Grunow 1884" /NCGR_SAMPLE_ID=MMETSP0160_2 /ASSEMBLY_ACC=CAM_ASM_000250 /LENGTH=287 /DNA_ID=CAMNT_0025471915 /DNA_START=33 /DNA_END=893 /DNA_ORIENTATION=+